MIIGEQKSLSEIAAMLEGQRKILIAGCRSCVAICLVGGEKEVAVLAESLRLLSSLKGKGWEVEEVTVERQCEKEWATELGARVQGKDAVLSLACGVGAQTIQSMYPAVRVLPGLNTSNMGAPEEAGVFLERCGGCGDCVLHLTGGICPIARCAKSLLNGPCGGTREGGKCEVDENTDCVWHLIYERAKARGAVESLLKVRAPRSWANSRHGGPKRMMREDLRP